LRDLLVVSNTQKADAGRDRKVSHRNGARRGVADAPRNFEVTAELAFGFASDSKPLLCSKLEFLGCPFFAVLCVLPPKFTGEELKVSVPPAWPTDLREEASRGTRGFIARVLGISEITNAAPEHEA
jgi:hypothetical protein